MLWRIERSGTLDYRILFSFVLSFSVSSSSSLPTLPVIWIPLVSFPLTFLPLLYLLCTILFSLLVSFPTLPGPNLTLIHLYSPFPFPPLLTLPSRLLPLLALFPPLISSHYWSTTQGRPFPTLCTSFSTCVLHPAPENVKILFIHLSLL